MGAARRRRAQAERAQHRHVAWLVACLQAKPTVAGCATAAAGCKRFAAASEAACGVAEAEAARNAAEDEEAALADYQSKVEEYQKQTAKLNRVGKSVQMLTLPVAGRPQEFTMIPFMVEKKSPAQPKVTTNPKKEQIDPGSSLVAEDPADKKENAAD